MRLMVVAAGGQLLLAARLAAQSGADIVCATGIADALKLLSEGSGADVVLIDAALAIENITAATRRTPVIAIGIGADAGIARAAIAAGAREYLPLPSDAEKTATLIAALAHDDPQTRASLKIN